MPGLEDLTHTTDLANLDYDHIKAFVYDIRAQTEWG